MKIIDLSKWHNSGTPEAETLQGYARRLLKENDQDMALLVHGSKVIGVIHSPEDIKHILTEAMGIRIQMGGIAIWQPVEVGLPLNSMMGMAWVGGPDGGIDGGGEEPCYFKESEQCFFTHDGKELKGVTHWFEISRPV